MRKCIVAMLESSDSACGESHTLLHMRAKVHTLFGGALPDPDSYGHDILDSETFNTKFGGDLSCFYKHVSEHHSGEIVQLVRTELPTVVQHPMTPDAHALQFYPCGTHPEILAVSRQFFATRWKQVDEHGQPKAEAAEAIARFLEKMKDFPNAVWRPSVKKGVYVSNMEIKKVKVSWHTLDSLVWSWASRDDAPPCNFADLYLFYARCTLLSNVRRHAPPSNNSRGGGNGKGKGKDEGKGAQKPR